MAMAQEQWQPTLNEQQTRQLINAYNTNPKGYTPHLERIRNHASYHNVPFYEGEFSLLEALKQAGAGFIEGFTTFNLLEHPDNQWESIIRNVSHLVGFAPGIVASPLQKLGFKAAALIPKRGIPLAIAEDVLLPVVKKHGKKALSSSLINKTKAGTAVAQFLSTPLAKDIATGAFNLGTASAISSWQHGVDAMMDSFFHGAIAGGVFKTIGNKIKMDDKQAQTFVRGLSGSLFMGLPDTVRGATVPDQIYNYLLGAYFGGKELSWQRTQAKKITQENAKTAQGSKDPYVAQTLDPTRFESWKEAPKEVKPLLYEEAKELTGIDLLKGEKPEALGYELLRKLGFSEKEIEEAKKEVESEIKEREEVEAKETPKAEELDFGIERYEWGKEEKKTSGSGKKTWFTKRIKGRFSDDKGKPAELELQYDSKGNLQKVLLWYGNSAQRFEVKDGKIVPDPQSLKKGVPFFNIKTDNPKSYEKQLFEAVGFENLTPSNIGLGVSKPKAPKETPEQTDAHGKKPRKYHGAWKRKRAYEDWAKHTLSKYEKEHGKDNIEVHGKELIGREIKDGTVVGTSDRVDVTYAEIVDTLPEGRAEVLRIVEPAIRNKKTGKFIKRARVVMAVGSRKSTYKESLESYRKELHIWEQEQSIRKKMGKKPLPESSKPKAPKKPKAETTKEAPKKPKPKQKYIITSGRRGLESTISKVAEKLGIKTVQTKLIDQRPVGKFGKGEEVILKPNILDAADKDVRIAIDEINNRVGKTGKGRIIDISKYQGGATGTAMMNYKRDAVKVKYSDSIVMMGELNKNHSELILLNRIPGQIAVNSGKDFYVFDKKLNSWFKYNPEAGNPLTKEAGVFEVMNTIPEIGDRAAFFAPETLDRAEVGAIQDVLKKQAHIPLKGEMPIITGKKENSELMHLEDYVQGEGFETTPDNSLSGIFNSNLSRNKGFIKKNPDIAERTSEISRIIEAAIDTYKPYVDKSKDMKGVYETNSYNWIKEVEKKTGYKFNEELKGQLRQWLVREKFGQLVRVAATDGTEENTVILSQESPRTRNNTLKNQVAPKSIIEEILSEYESIVTEPSAPAKELKLNKIISGFQIGVDQKGLEIGKEFGYETGGTAPKGFFTAKGKQPDLAKKYGLSEVSEDVTKAYTGPEKFYGPRTEKNIIDSDGTIVWGNIKSPGSKLTINLAKKHNKPVIVNPTSSEMRNWLINNNIETLNTAGNRKPPPGFKKMMREAIAPKPSTEKGPRYTQSKAGVRHVPELTGKDLTKTTKEVRDTIENTEGVTLRSGHKAVWFGPEDYVYTGAKHKAKEMPDNIRELKNEVEDALELPRDYYDSVLMNKLPKGTKIGAHRDAEDIFKQKDGTIGSVGVLSLGGESVIDIQKPYGKSVEKHTIKSGDVYELPAGKFQATGMDHFHAVGPSKTDRLSLTFRRTKFAPELTEPVSQPMPTKTTPDIKPGPATVYVDAIDYNGQDVPIRRFVSRAANLISAELDKHGNPKYRTYEDAYLVAEELLRTYTKNIVKSMNDKYDMHLWGGEGDKDRLVFVKHHPEADKVVIPKDAIPKDLLDFAKENYGLTKEQEIRAMKSLIKYHEDINGVSIQETIGKDGWIDSTVKLNKRLPIIMNTGWRGDKAFINNPRMVGNLRLSNQGNYKAIIVKDAKKLAEILGVDNIDLLQITDGSVIAESATLNGIQKDRGSNYQGQEKSVLVWNGLLNKYMHHKTLPEGNQMMRDFKNADPELNDGINFIIYDSSAKQRGNHPVGNYEIKNGKLELTEGAEVFEIDPGALRYNYGVYDGPSDLGYKNGIYRGIGVPKQTLIIPSPDMLVKTDVKHSEDFFNTLVGDAFKGTKSANTALLDYQAEISKNKDVIPGTEADLIRKHFHEMGVAEIQEILTKPGYEKLAQEMILEMLNINHESQQRLVMEGEGYGRQVSNELNNIADFRSAAENIIKHAAALDMPAIPLFLGKYSKGFIEKTVNKWLTDKVFRPKVKNSLKSRMRPYDKWLREKFPEANDDNLAMKKFGVPSDELMFLGDLLKPAPFYDPVKKKMSTLGEVWDIYQKETDKTKRKLYEDTFDALVIRTPQDSASGAQVLRFAGFTGIKDHGSMLHGRAMEKLGGADLDADSDFIFFGGRHKDGTGEGFKTEWKEMYRAQKDEFIRNNKYIDVKDEHKEDIVLTRENLEELGINPNLFDYAQNTNSKYPYLQYSPSLRTFVGEQTATSRELMPPIVSLVQNSRAAWSSVLRSPSKIDLIEEGTIIKNTFYKNLKEPIVYRVTRKPKTSKEDKLKQLTLSSALVRFTADPANELGLVSYQRMKTLLDQTYYEPRVYEIFNSQKGKWETYDRKSFNIKIDRDSSATGEYSALTLDAKRVLAPDVTKGSRYDLISNINRAFFGWDYNEGSNWTHEQKQELIKGIENLSEAERSTALPKLGYLMKDVDLRMSVFDRVNSKEYNKMHNEYTRIFRGLPDKDTFKELLGRTRLDRPKSKHVQFVFDTQLNNAYYREQLAEKGGKALIKMFDNALKKGKKITKEERKLEKKKIRKWHDIKETDTKEEIIVKLNSVLKQVEDYLGNAVWEMATTDLIINEYKKAINNGKKISKNEMESMLIAIEKIKEANSARFRERQESYDNTRLEEESSLSNSRNKHTQELSNAIKGKDLKESKGSAILDQVEIDNMIRGFKKDLSSEYARNVFDYLLLGSLKGRKEQRAINDYMKESKDTPFKQDVLEGLFTKGAKTGTSQAAFNSTAVSSKNIINFLKKQNGMYDSSLKPLNKIPPKVKEHVKKFEESKVIESIDPIEQLKKANLDQNAILSDFIGWDRLKKGKISPENKKIIFELADLIKTDPNFHPSKINKTLMGLYAYIDPFDPVIKTLDQMNATDFQNMINTYKQIKNGTIHQRLEKNLPLLKQLSLKARHHMQFPLMVSTEQLSKDIISVKRKGYMKDWSGGEPKEIDILYPTSWGEILQTEISRLDGLKDAHSARLSNKFMDKIRFLSQAPGEDGLALHNIATATIQLKQNFESPEIKKRYQDHEKYIKKLYNWDKLKKGNYNLDIDGKGRKQYSGEKVVEIVENIIEAEYKSLQELNTGKLERIPKEDYEKLPKSEKNLWKKDLETGEYTKHPLEEYTLGFYDSKKTQRILNINKFMKDLSNAFYEGPDKALDFAINVGTDGIMQLLKTFAKEKMLHTKYVKEEINKKTGEPEIIDEISIEEYNKLPLYKRKGWISDKKVNQRLIDKLEMPLTGTKKGYIPHYFNDTSASAKTMNKELNKISEKYNRLLKNSGPKEEKRILNQYAQEYKATLMKYKFQNGDYDLGSQQDLHTALDMLMFKNVKKQLVESEVERLSLANLPSITKRAGHTRSRENDKMDWIVDPAIHGIYIQNATKALYGSLTNLITRNTLDKMSKHNYKKIVGPYVKKDGKPKKGKEKDYKEALEVRDNWDWFWQQYVREAQGMSTIVSPEVWNNPNLHVSTTPYGWFADNIWAQRLNKIGDALGLLDKKGELPKELQGLNDYDIQKLSSLEARYQLATLMTHPKTPINNIFGGTMHTFQSVGFEAMRKAYDYEFLQTLNPKWKSKEDVYRDLDEKGVSLDLARHELGLDKNLRNIGNDKFLDAIASRATGDKEITRQEKEALRKEYGITKPIMDIAAKFMSVPERRLRRDAYIAHYIRAWERFGGAISNPDSPILVEIAKKGVKATQFLYSAPFRPAFARSGVGKIMSRFQLWAWNAVRFRNDVRKQAARYGYKPGSPGMKKFERMMTTDLFVIALGSMFMYSMFEQIIPAPYSWLQDTAQWVFGDENERDRAFFGTYPAALAPLQLVTPPIARLPISFMREFIEDDYTKLADYYMWTFFPFGRMARDLFHPEKNVFANPMRIPEKFFGFPLTGLSKHSKRMREEEYRPLHPGQSLKMF